MTTEKKYTPGPWSLLGLNDGEPMAVDCGDEMQSFVSWIYTVGNDRMIVAEPGGMSHGRGSGWQRPDRRSEVLANARLIAAAPELLEALEDLLAGWELMIGQYGYDPGQEPEDSLNMKARAAIAKALGQ